MFKPRQDTTQETYTAINLLQPKTLTTAVLVVVVSWLLFQVMQFQKAKLSIFAVRCRVISGLIVIHSILVWIAVHMGERVVSIVGGCQVQMRVDPLWILSGGIQLPAIRSIGVSYSARRLRSHFHSILIEASGGDFLGTGGFHWNPIIIMESHEGVLL